MRLRYGIAFYHNIHCHNTVSYFGSIRTVIHSAPAMENLLQNTIRTDYLGTCLSNIRSTMVVWTLHGKWIIDYVRNIINYFMQSLITRDAAFLYVRWINGLCVVSIVLLAVALIGQQQVTVGSYTTALYLSTDSLFHRG